MEYYVIEHVGSVSSSDKMLELFTDTLKKSIAFRNHIANEFMLQLLREVVCECEKVGVHITYSRITDLMNPSALVDGLVHVEFKHAYSEFSPSYVRVVSIAEYPSKKSLTWDGSALQIVAPNADTAKFSCMSIPLPDNHGVRQTTHTAFLFGEGCKYESILSGVWMNAVSLFLTDIYTEIKQLNGRLKELFTKYGNMMRIQNEEDIAEAILLSSDHLKTIYVKHHLNKDDFVLCNRNGEAF